MNVHIRTHISVAYVTNSLVVNKISKTINAVVLFESARLKDLTIYVLQFKRAICEHERIHTGEKPFGCRFCDRRFPFKNSCTSRFCDKKFINCSERSKLVLIHTDERPYQCRFCDRKFNRTDHCSVHERSHTNPYQCSICNKKLSCKQNLKIHENSHAVK